MVLSGICVEMLGKTTENLRISIVRLMSSQVPHLVETIVVWLTVTSPILQGKFRKYIIRLRRSKLSHIIHD